jgi:hypothetical protein
MDETFEEQSRRFWSCCVGLGNKEEETITRLQAILPTLTFEKIIIFCKANIYNLQHPENDMLYENLGG